MSVANRSWRDTVFDHGMFSLVILLTGPFALLFSGVSFGWYMLEGVHIDDNRVDTDIMRVAGLWFVYGLVWCLALAYQVTPLF